MKPITLAGFDDKFIGSDDPWNTFASADEALKRTAILHALGAGPLGRVLELGAGNGSNSRAIAPRARRLDATEATAAGTGLVDRALTGLGPRARATRLAVPGAFPQPRYDAIVVAELLYYLTPRAMAQTARDVARALRPGGCLVLAHHRIDFYDFVQHAAHVHRDFLAQTRAEWRVRTVRATARWTVLACVRAAERGSIRR